jgi:uncharacterized repeat protein (TIGR03943 family)
VRRETQGIVVLAFGLVLFQLAWFGQFQWYVKSNLRWPLFATAALLVVLGLTCLFTPDDESGDEHHSGHGPRIGMLLLLPLVMFLVVQPAPLGAFAAARGVENRVPDVVSADAYPALPEARDGAVDIRLSDLLSRIAHEPNTPVRTTPVRLTGFVTPDENVADGFRLTRFAISCCAADAVPMQVVVRGVADVPPADTWIEVVAVWSGEVVEAERTWQGGLPVMDPRSIRTIDGPSAPYEY